MNLSPFKVTKEFKRYNLGLFKLGPLEQCSSGRLMEYKDHAAIVLANSSENAEYKCKMRSMFHERLSAKEIEIRKLRRILLLTIVSYTTTITLLATHLP